MRLRVLCPLLCLISSVPAFAQWTDVKQIGIGGETTIASDGSGRVYVTGHLPCCLFVSRDWGNSFERSVRFSDALGDMFVLARPGGLVNVEFLRAAINGIGSWYSTDGARTVYKGENFDGPLDREWLVANQRGQLFMDYSNGYIGGPKSKGVFLATSTNGGRSFAQTARVDNEVSGSYAVDPYLAISSTGRLYGMWATSNDYDTITKFRIATSSNGGRSFSGHKTIAVFPKEVNGQKVDTQERWMLGTILAVGPSKVVVVYPAYKEITANGASSMAMVEMYTYSLDGGKNFAPGRTVLSEDELRQAASSYEAIRPAGPVPRYVETLPWLCSDCNGKIYLAFTDDRNGQGPLGKGTANKWNVRYSVCSDLEKGFSWSEQVSEDYLAERPPMDFLSCCTDPRYFYVSWTEGNGGFSGPLFVGRKRR